MTQTTKAKILFTMEIKPTHSRRLATLLRHASKQVPGKMEELNAYFKSMCMNRGHKDPGACQLTLINNMLVVEEDPAAVAVVASKKGGDQV